MRHALEGTKVRAAIRAGVIRGFFPETIVTLEGVQRKDRPDVFSSTRLQSDSTSTDENTITISIGVVQDRKSLHPKFSDKIQAARSLGLRALRAPARIGWIRVEDEDGTFFQPNYIIALLFDYLVETRGWKNGVGKSVATTNFVNALAKYHGVELHETPVGFKYIGELIKQDKIAIGGEESAGLSIRYHVPEKDGILAGLLCCEMVARRGKSLRQQLTELFGKVGSFYPQRENFRLTEEVKEKFTKKLSLEPKDFSGHRVKEVVRTDGLKLVLDDGSWVCYRLSGTEPVVRVYSEAGGKEELENLSAAAKQWIFE